VSAGNGNSGVVADTIGSAIINVMVRNSTIANNNNDGLAALGAASTIRVTRSTITGNSGAGWFVSGTGVVTSYLDNNIDGNTTGNGAPPNTGYK
jgi:hypothetical protein